MDLLFLKLIGCPLIGEVTMEMTDRKPFVTCKCPPLSAEALKSEMSFLVQAETNENSLACLKVKGKAQDLCALPKLVADALNSVSLSLET